MSESDPTLHDANVPRFVTQTGLAEFLGISKQRVSQLKSDGGLPAPDGIIGDEILLWTIETARQFSDERKKALGWIGLQE